MKRNLMIVLALALVVNFFMASQEDIANTKTENQHIEINNPLTSFKTKVEDELSRAYISPERILWKSDTTNQYITNEQVLLKKGNGQADLESDDLMMLKSTKENKPSLLLDFGKELHGGIRIVTSFNSTGRPVKIRVRLGESVAEAMAVETYGKHNATNDHAVRDFEIEVPWLGKIEIGNSGFRFARIDLVQENVELKVKEISAILVYRDIPYLGSFESDNDRLNKIWETGAYTVHLNMQDYLWDGIKRDRLVWLGDMHPEIMTIAAVFGNNKVVPKTLDLARDITKLPKWMNGISSYSMWWIIIQYQWYYNYGNLEYLKEQKQYLTQLLELLLSKTTNNLEKLDGHRFLDWPTQGNNKAIHAGLQSLLIMALQQGGELCDILEEDALAEQCNAKVSKLKKHIPDHDHIKQAAALMVLSGILNPEKVSEEILIKDGAKGISAFYGYYVLQALAESGHYTEAMDMISTYWGGMLDMGATTFWEEFELEEKSLSSRIDELPSPSLKNYHAETGAHCYIGYRRSLCHGWASGPTAWLSEHVLGIKILAPGMKKIAIKPNLGDLKWVKGSYPTPYGIIKVNHKKLPNGQIESQIEVPDEIMVVN